MNTNSEPAVQRERSVNALTNLENHQIKVNGNTINFYEGGQGTTVLLIHGFPNSSADWRNQIPALIDAGYRVVAADLIGLGDSDMPADVEQYTVAKDTENVLAVLDTLQIEQMHIVCHDRGTGPGWSIAVSQPERVRSLTSLTVGHLNAWAEGGLELREKCWYWLFFQFKVAEEALSQDQFKLFKEWMRYHPNVEEWVANLARPGRLTAGINWYRANGNLDRVSWGRLPNVKVPTQILWSPDDFYSSTEAVLESHKYVDGPYRTVRVDGATHFMMHDRPELITQHILEFLSQHSATTKVAIHPN